MKELEDFVISSEDLRLTHTISQCQPVDMEGSRVTLGSGSVDDSDSSLKSLRFLGKRGRFRALNATPNSKWKVREHQLPKLSHS